MGPQLPQLLSQNAALRGGGVALLSPRPCSTWAWLHRATPGPCARARGLRVSPVAPTQIKLSCGGGPGDLRPPHVPLGPSSPCQCP